MQQAPAETIELHREMSITHADFRRLLPAAAQGFALAGDGPGFTLSAPDGGRSLAIELGPEQQRRLGALSLPLTAVTLRFDGFDPTSYAAFLKRFDLAFQRGGG